MLALRPLVLVAAISPALLLAHAGLAQQYVGGQGRALDANLSATQGRINPQGQDISALSRFNEAVAAGTAGYGKSLRVGSVDRTLSGFRGSYATQSLYDFNRDSTSGQQVARGIATADALRYQNDLSSGRAIPFRFADALTSAPRGEAYSGQNSIDLRSAAQIESTRARLPTVMGYATTGDRRVAIVASPLAGIANYDMGDAAGRRGAITGIEASARGIQQPADLFRSDRDNAKTDTKAAPARGTAYDTILDGFRDASANTRLDTRLGDAPKPAQGDQTAPKPGDKPGEKSGEKTGDKPGDRPVAKPQTGSATDLPSTGNWKDPLDALKDRLRRDAKRAANDTTRDARSNDPARSVGGPARENLQSTKDLLGRERDGNKPAQPAPTPTDPGKPAPADPARDITMKVDLVASQLERSRAAVKALVSSDTRIESVLLPGDEALGDFGRLMRQGESELSTGHYFDAEATFINAQTYRLSDVMSQVGMVHARIGSGLLASAASGLEDLLRLTPEVIPVRYGPRVLPAPARVQKIAADLRTEAKNPAQGTGGPGTGLMLAYLGYQFGNREWLDAGLACLKARTSPSDESAQALLETVSTVWTTKFQGATPDEPPAKPAPAGQ